MTTPAAVRSSMSVLGEEADSVISSTVASTGTSNAILSHGNSTDSSGVGKVMLS